MGNYESDQKNARFFGLKLSRNTDREIIEHLEQQSSIQGYLKNLILKDMKGGRTMASRAFYRNAMMSATAIENMVSDMVDSGTSQEEYDELVSKFRRFMIDELEKLDDRLWWQPETGEIFFEDDGSDKALPDPDGFAEWWNETAGSWTI